MFASVINYGSSLIFGVPEESQRVPATDGESSSCDPFTEKFEDSWVVIDQVCTLLLTTISQKAEKVANFKFLRFNLKFTITTACRLRLFQLLDENEQKSFRVRMKKNVLFRLGQKTQFRKSPRKGGKNAPGGLPVWLNLYYFVIKKI